MLRLGVGCAWFARAEKTFWVVSRVRPMAVEAPWGTLVRRGGCAAVAVVLFQVFGGAAETAFRGAGAGAGVVPQPAPVVLDDCSSAGHEAGGGSGAKEA